MLFKAKKILQFKLKVFPRGHTPTNYTRWFATSQPYHVRGQGRSAKKGDQGRGAGYQTGMKNTFQGVI